MKGISMTLLSFQAAPLAGDAMKNNFSMA